MEISENPTAAAMALYIPADRRYALAGSQPLPDRTRGTVLFADISGFTPLTEAITRVLGPRRGAEEVTRQINLVYDALIDEVSRYGGSVISFSGDAITCWFDEHPPFNPGPAWNAPLYATACALALQAAMQARGSVPLPDGGSTTLALKVALATGPVRRFLVGDPDIQLMDALGGATLARMAAGEHSAEKGDVLVDDATAGALGAALEVREWRSTDAEGESHRFAVVQRLAGAAAHPPHLELPTPPLPLEQASQWVLPAVGERIRDGLGEFLTELRPAVALFLRFEGIDYDGDDQAGAKLDAFVRWIQGELRRLDGGLLQLTIGDKGSYIYAAFGAPLAHEDDVPRALGAALALRRLPPAVNFIQSVQLGLSQGTMRTGAYGADSRHTYGVLGDEVNLAARLMQQAGPDQVLASGRVYKLAADTHDWETLPPIRVKGKQEPVAVFELLGQLQGQTPAARRAGALVGRDTELAQLEAFLQPAFAGRFAGLMYVHGEPGVGKSRLVDEVRRRMTASRPLSWFICPAEGMLRQPLNAFQYFLRGYFNQIPDSPEAQNRERFTAGLESLLADLRQRGTPEAAQAADELDRTRSFLGALAGGLHWEGSLYERVEAQLRLENTLIAVKTLILAESLRQPVVLEIEDAHLLDGDSETLVGLLARNVESYPLAVLINSRYRDDGSRVAFVVDPDVPQAALDLNTLSADGIRALAAQVLGAEPDADLQVFLARKTNGNPFFLEQLALDLRERGLLDLHAPAEGQPAVARLAKAAETEAVPESITGVLVARLDRLAAQIKAVVQTASVLGQEFEVLVLSRMLMGDERLPDKVHRAETEAVWSAMSETRYIFRHAMLRDAAYDMQLQSRLRELHTLAGSALEQVHAGEEAENAAVLAFHWGAAGHTAKETHYSILAGEAVLRTSAYRDALRYFRRALELLPDDGADTAARRTRLTYDLGETYAGLGQLKEAREQFNTSLALARESGDRKYVADALSFLGGLEFRLGEAAHAEKHLQEGLDLAREAGDEQAVATILNRLGLIARARRDSALAIRLFEESLAKAQLANDQVTMAQALNNLGNVALMAKQLENARQRYEEAQRLFRAIGKRSGMVITLNNQGMISTELGDFTRALRLYQDALATCLEIGDQRMRAGLLDNLGDLEYRLGHDAAAESYFGDSLKSATLVGEVSSALLALAGIARLWARPPADKGGAGRHEPALELLGLILHHPACDDEVRQRAEPVLEELRARLPAGTVQAALARGQARDLAAVAQEILAAH